MIAAVAILLAVPVLAVLLVGLYARDGPQLWGVPFFYWYQFVWVLVGCAFTAAAHAVIRRSRKTPSSREVHQ